MLLRGSRFPACSRQASLADGFRLHFVMHQVEQNYNACLPPAGIADQQIILG
jgi:hypothetical protein